MSEPDPDAVGTDAAESWAVGHGNTGQNLTEGYPQPPFEDEDTLEPTIVLGRE